MDYFTDNQIGELISMLLRLTSAGRLTWQKWESEFEFICRRSLASFSIESKDHDDYAPHVLTILANNENGELRVIQAVDSTYVAPELAAQLAELYEVVKKTTMRIDVVAKNILNDLIRLENEHEPKNASA